MFAQRCEESLKAKKNSQKNVKWYYPYGIIIQLRNPATQLYLLCKI